jgi:type IV pilus assembly protein PilA
MKLKPLILLLMILTAVTSWAQTNEKRKENEASAIEVMRLIHAVEITYLDGIGKGSFGSEIDIFREDFIDEELANALGVPKMRSLGEAECKGDKTPFHGYLFKLTLSKSPEGKPKFICLATPTIATGEARSGDRSFYVDETGLIRFSKDANNIANANSPAIAD